VAQQLDSAGNIGRTPPVTFTVLSPGTTTTPAGTGTTTPSGNTTSTGSTKTASLSLSGPVSGGAGRVRLTIACRGSGVAAYDVTVSLSSLERLTAGRVTAVTARDTRTVAVGSAHTVIAAGNKRTLTIGLNSSGRQLLAHFARLPVRLRLALVGRSGTGAVVTQTLTVTPPKPGDPKPANH
jgi:hypothetical protein